jgi:hypothetical protein
MIGRHAWLAAAAAIGICLPWPALAQPPEWKILDNSFLVEEAFNQERGIVQNIFTWTLARSGEWGGSFTQEWPAPAMRHQLSYTIPFSRADGVGGFNDVLINYRFQIAEGNAGSTAIAPRLSVIVPTGNAGEGLGAGHPGVQANLPVSKPFGNLYVHANAGVTWIRSFGSVTTLAGSGIWQATPMFHLMLEAVEQIDVQAFTLSPGFRRGWGEEKQIVVGLAVPVTWTDRATRAALLTYFSYELPFRKLH